MQDEQVTTIGESIFVTGALSGHEDLTVLGRVEGTITLSKTLFVAESGIVKADVTVDDAVISGVVVGNVTATNSVQVTETGRLLGDLRAPRIIVVAGARVRGQVDMSDRNDASVGQSSREVPAQAISRNAHGRFERLGLPARRPMPQAPNLARQPASSSAPQHSPAEAHAQQRAHGSQGQHAHGRDFGRDHGGGRSSEQASEQSGGQSGEHSRVSASAPRRTVSSHKKRAAARRRD